LIRANENARNALLGLEDLSEEDMRRLHAKFAALARLGTVPEEIEGAREDLDLAQEDVEHAKAHIARAVTAR
jgi:outer membrane protein TolC